MSAVKVHHAQTYKETGEPSDGGINDLHMGTNDRMYPCKTCNGGKNDCPGHFGHISLAKPLYHVEFIDEIRRVL